MWSRVHLTRLNRDCSIGSFGVMNTSSRLCMTVGAPYLRAKSQRSFGNYHIPAYLLPYKLACTPISSSLSAIDSSSNAVT